MAEPNSPCHGLSGAFGHPAVRIGWYPYRARWATEVRTRPQRGGGSLLKSVRGGAGLAYQSTRNPDHEPLNPHHRPPIKNDDGELFAWVYTRAGTIAGYVPLGDIEVDPDAASKPELLGPAGRDWEVGRTLPLLKKKSGCGELSAVRPIREVKARETYLRYSPRGTAFHYLHRGDLVKILIVNAGHGFCFGEVVGVSPYSGARIGSRGWLLHNVL